MKKENQKNKLNFSISKINNIISKLNRTGIILIAVCYIILLMFVLSTIGKDISYIVEKNYEQVYYDDEISPQLVIKGLRTFDEENNPTLKYEVSVNIAGRLEDGKDPKYKISNFRMSASTVARLTDEEPNNTYYFTEHSTYSTPVNHSFTVDNSEKNQHLSTMYVRLQYEDGNKTKVSTFKENIYLQPSEKDILNMNNWYDENNVIDETNPENNVYPSVTMITGKNTEKQIGIFEVSNYMEETNGKETGIYKTNFRIRITDTEISKFHIDAQAWVVTESGEYLPFFGIYNYTGYSKTYRSSSVNLNSKLKPAYIVAKIDYLELENKEIKTYTSYFKQDLKNIRTTFATNPEIGVTPQTDVSQNRITSSVITIIATLSAAVVLVGGLYIYNKQKEKKQNKKMLDNE